jgi:WD40 repeat protein
VFRTVAGIAIVVAVIAALLGVWAFRQKDAAVRQKKAAHSEELAARADNELSLEPRLSLAYALAAMDAKRTPDAEQALRVSLAESRVRSLLRGDTNWVNTIKWSPDGTAVLTASDDKTARIWDPTKPKEALRVFKLPGFVNMANWNWDGSRIVAASENGAWIYAVKGDAKPVVLRVGKPTKDCSESNTCVSVAGFGGPKSQYVLTASFDDKVRVWDSQTGKLLWQKTVDSLGPTAIDGSGTRVIVTHGLSDLQSEIYDWRQPSRKPVPINKPDATTGKHTQTDKVNSVTFSKDGRYVITGSEDKTIAVWDARTGENLVRLFGSREGLLGVDMSPPPEKYVAAASKDGGVYLWDWRAENRLPKIIGHTDVVSDVAFSPDGAQLASASGDRTARIWALPPLQTLVHTQPVKWAAWAPDDRYAITATAQCDSDPFICKAFLWDAENQVAQPKLVKVLAKHTDWVTGAGFSPDSSKVVTASDDDTARVWAVPSGKPLVVLKGHTDWLNSASFSPNGKYVITSSLDGTARIWNWRQAKTIRTIHGIDSIGSASFDPSGRYVVTTGGTPHDYTVKVWDWQKNVKTPIRTLKGHTGAVNYAEWSPEGNYIVSASSDGTARVWNWRTGKTLSVLRGQAGALEDASFSPNGRLIVTVSTAGTTRIWVWRIGKAISETAWHTDTIHSGAFSPDGGRILTSSDDWSADIFFCETCGDLPDLVNVARARIDDTISSTELKRLLGTTKAP